MKCIVWLDLPKALGNLCQDFLNDNDVKYLSLLSASTQNFTKNFNSLQQLITTTISNFSENEKKLLKNKLIELKKEEINLECQNIKFSIKLMSHLLNHIENLTNKEIEDNINDLLLKIKLFSKITRLIIEKTNEELEIDKENKQRHEFFLMIKAYTEKAQNKLYNLSNQLITKVLEIKIKNESSLRKKEIPKKEMHFFQAISNVPNSLVVPITN